MIDNMLDKKNNLIDSVFKDFESNLTDNHDTPSRQAITIWVPDEYKAKYDKLQEITKRKFGKLVKEVVKKSIDKVQNSSIANGET